MGSKFVCLGICLQLSTLAQTGLMFTVNALSVDQGKHFTRPSLWQYLTHVRKYFMKKVECFVYLLKGKFVTWCLSLHDRDIQRDIMLVFTILLVGITSVWVQVFSSFRILNWFSREEDKQFQALTLTKGLKKCFYITRPCLTM